MKDIRLVNPFFIGRSVNDAKVRRLAMLVNLKIQFEKFDAVDMAMEGLYSLDDAAADTEKLKGVYDGQMKLVRLNI